MKLIKQYIEIVDDPIDGPDMLKKLERIGRVCYKSEDKITPESAPRFVNMLLHNYKHESVIEHVNVSIFFLTDRGVTHEMVRHRIASYSQESTRYVNYTKDKHGGEGKMKFILPVWFYEYYDFWHDVDQSPMNGNSELDNATLEKALTHFPNFWNLNKRYFNWQRACQESERRYNLSIGLGEKPQEARQVLNNSLKTEITMTANLREWRHFFKLRTAKNAHPQMRHLANLALDKMKEKIPVIFDDIFGYYESEWPKIENCEIIQDDSGIIIEATSSEFLKKMEQSLAMPKELLSGPKIGLATELLSKPTFHL